MPALPPPDREAIVSCVEELTFAFMFTPPQVKKKERGRGEGRGEGEINPSFKFH